MINNGLCNWDKPFIRMSYSQCFHCFNDSITPGVRKTLCVSYDSTWPSGCRQISCTNYRLLSKPIQVKITYIPHGSKYLLRKCLGMFGVWFRGLGTLSNSQTVFGSIDFINNKKIHSLPLPPCKPTYHKYPQLTYQSRVSISCRHFMTSNILCHELHGMLMGVTRSHDSKWQQQVRLATFLARILPWIWLNLLFSSWYGWNMWTTNLGLLKIETVNPSNPPRIPAVDSPWWIDQPENMKNSSDTNPSFWHAKINEQYSWMNVISVMTSETIPILSCNEL